MPASGRRATIGVGAHWVVRSAGARSFIADRPRHGRASSGIGAAVARSSSPEGTPCTGPATNPDTVANPVPGVTYVRLDNADYATADAAVEQIKDRHSHQ